MQEMFRRAHDHKGAAIVEIFQNCNVFNDEAWETLTLRANREDMLIPLEHGKPVRFGKDLCRGVIVTPDGSARIVDVSDVGEDAILVHDEHRPEPGLALILSQLAHNVDQPTPIGVFRAVETPEYADQTQRQLVAAQERTGAGDLDALLHSLPTWEV